ncbi:MAG: cell division FtsZ family protein, partial [Bacteroidales bacterium]|nr:cell division FtsZ family protein [Bacteroidales bacterium]
MDADLIPTSWEKRGNIITVVGVGGGGNNAISYMYTLGLKDVDFVVCNTDLQALQSSPVPTKLQIGPVLTKGLGAGTDYLIGRKAAEESIEEISKIFAGDTQMVFVTCGMGGGTGTGAAPLVAKTAKEMGKLTVGVVTVPFRDEGKEALYRAVEGIKELSKHVDSILVIDNQKLYQLYGKMGMKKAFSKADEVLATAVKSIAEIITSSGY